VNRLRGSALKVAELSELPVFSQEEYEKLDIRFSLDPDQLNLIKQKMKHIK
jgi:hypothetical protein